MNFLVHADHLAGEIRLTTGGPFRHHINELVLCSDGDEAFRPSDMITTEDRTVLAAVMVYEWASRDGRTEEEMNAARRYLGRWPTGPQIE
jgi:hypothetical protein